MRTMALDLGSKYIGIALSDTLGMIARPLTMIRRTSRVDDFTTYRQLISDHQVQTIVVGLPFNMDGTEGKQAQWVRDYIQAFSQTIDIPIILWDERLTTETAAAILKENMKQPTKKNINAVAAAVILQSYLDANST
ncbi:MAG: Holliday junction resolvase RuvX [Anaerolineae bacterium]|nr:Holliday junction resolvase RuvX [Anaerolineae bacterium]